MAGPEQGRTAGHSMVLVRTDGREARPTNQLLSWAVAFTRGSKPLGPHPCQVAAMIHLLKIFLKILKQSNLQKSCKNSTKNPVSPWPPSSQ